MFPSGAPVVPLLFFSDAYFLALQQIFTLRVAGKSI